jgi:3-deoxy-D-manno-octulosonate 8-phosphate phosphatase (KDO 8-P phosphatase)
MMAAIRGVALDVDGVLTDGGFWWGPDGAEFKRFSFLDVMGISLGTRAGLTFALITGETSPLVDRFAEKMGIRDVSKGCKDKVAALRTFAERNGIPMDAVCYMGDDINDLPAMAIVGLSAAPASAHDSALKAATFVTTRRGGDGAVREVIDRILSTGNEAP